MPFVGSSIVASDAAVTTEIFNVALGPINTEQSQLINGTIKGYIIKTRGSSDLKITHVSGESGTKFINLNGNASFEDTKTYNDLTIYFQSPSTGDTVEIWAWKA